MPKSYQDEVVQAIPYLLQNTNPNKIDTAVIRRCTPSGLSEIAKHSTKAQKDLTQKIREIVNKENNNGIRNVYLKALKEIEQQQWYDLISSDGDDIPKIIISYLLLLLPFTFIVRIDSATMWLYFILVDIRIFIPYSNNLNNAFST